MPARSRGSSDEAAKKPRRFSLHWGEGTVAEEARVQGEHHDPALQLLRFDDGAVQVRFCYYDKRGRFQRSPLILGDDEIELLREELAGQPELLSILRRLVS